MEQLLELGREVGLDPQITSAFRDLGKQRDEFRTCLTAQGARGFPVKDPLCSQHVWGYAFDMTAGATPERLGDPLPLPGSRGVLSISRHLLCQLFGEPEMCDPGVDTREAGSNQFLLGELARSIGLLWSATDSVHFFTFPRSQWDQHMTRTFQTSCETCHHPGGPPF